jgi:hypothetical protein
VVEQLLSVPAPVIIAGAEEQDMISAHKTITASFSSVLNSIGQANGLPDGWCFWFPTFCAGHSRVTMATLELASYLGEDDIIC